MSTSPHSESWKVQEPWTRELQEQGITNARYETYRSHQGLHIRLIVEYEGRTTQRDAVIDSVLLRSRTCKSGQRKLLKAVRDSLRAGFI